MRIDVDRLQRPSGAHGSGWRRMPTIAADGMVATSHPLATRAGVRGLERGGNAVDAALAAAAMLTVAEPTDTGIGGDAFAIVWENGLYGLNGSGRAPAHLDGAGHADGHGPRSVTVPGAVRAWSDLAARFGRLGLDAAIAPAVDATERGVACTARIADKWSRATHAPWPPPRVGERFSLPELARTLRAVAEDGPDAFYAGGVAAAISAGTWLSEDDLASHRSEWVEPLRRIYRGVEVCELPPNGQGAAALLALGLYEGLEPTLHSRIESVKLALADTEAVVNDGPLPDDFFAPDRLAARRSLVDPSRALVPPPYEPVRGGTTYVAVVDGDGMAVSFIQSVFGSFGSGVVAPGTGVVLQNRAAGFAADPAHPNALAAGRRPLHTIIPGMLLEGGGMLGPFGVMGGRMQAQGHFQVVVRLVDDGDDPQAALDAPRFRVGTGRVVSLEPGLDDQEGWLRGLGHAVVPPEDMHAFGVGQVILKLGDALVAGSDGRGDGGAGGL